MPFVIAIVLLVIGSIVFHVMSPWWLTPIVSNWSAIDQTIDITLYVTGFVFVTVNLFLAWCVFKFRFSAKRRANYEPENKKLEGWLTVLTAIGVAAMLTPGLFVWASFVEVPEDAIEVEVVGQQWQWSFRYPGADGILGAADPGLITPENPFGMNVNDPYGQDDILVNSKEMHLPVNVPVKFNLRSKDVLHDFTVPQFRVKMDLVPGSVTYMWARPEKTGTYDILCEELCGIGHHIMRGRVVIQEIDDYNSWLATQTTYAEQQAILAGDSGQGAAFYAVCSACHGQNGEGNMALNAPKIAGLPAWYLTRQIEYFKNGVRGGSSDDVYGMQMAPMAATLATPQITSNVMAYISSLPDVNVEETIAGDVGKGAKLYEKTCGVCHGLRGEGVWSVNAPPIAGMSDWYLARQLKNYKNGVRGSHHMDEFGYQMVSMVTGLKNDDEINDVVAYINSLR